jgi:hypothetical protein
MTSVSLWHCGAFLVHLVSFSGHVLGSLNRWYLHFESVFLILPLFSRPLDLKAIEETANRKSLLTPTNVDDQGMEKENC